MAKKKSSSQSTQEDLTQKALIGIKRMMFHNEIVAGQKLPFRDLAEKMEMSPTPVIQALKFLEFQGLVRREPNKGYYIEPLSLSEVEEIYKYRELLEVSLVKETIEQLDDKAIKTLTESYEAYLQSLNGIFINEKLLMDKEFHMTLANLSGQYIRVQSLKSAFDLLHLKYRTSLTYVSSKKSDETEHGKIFDAVLARDTDKACQYLSAHVAHSGKHAVLNLSRMIEEKEGFALFHS